MKLHAIWESLKLLFFAFPRLKISFFVQNGKTFMKIHFYSKMFVVFFFHWEKNVNRTWAIFTCFQKIPSQCTCKCFLKSVFHFSWDFLVRTHIDENFTQLAIINYFYMLGVHHHSVRRGELGSLAKQFQTEVLSGKGFWRNSFLFVLKTLDWKFNFFQLDLLNRRKEKFHVSLELSAIFNLKFKIS